MCDVSKAVRRAGAADIIVETLSSCPRRRVVLTALRRQVDINDELKPKLLHSAAEIDTADCSSCTSSVATSQQVWRV